MSNQPWLAGTLAMAMLAGVSQAQHADIEIELDGTAIEIHEPHVDEELWTSILTNPATQFSTADWPAPTTIFPGIEAEDGTFPDASGNIYFQPLSQLYFHDGTAGGPVGRDVGFNGLEPAIVSRSRFLDQIGCQRAHGGDESGDQCEAAVEDVHDFPFGSLRQQWCGHSCLAVVSDDTGSALSIALRASGPPLAALSPGDESRLANSN